VLQITGAGFSTATADLKVLVGNNICRVTASTRESITCTILPNTDSTINPLHGNAGMFLEVWPNQQNNIWNTQNVVGKVIPGYTRNIATAEYATDRM